MRRNASRKSGSQSMRAFFEIFFPFGALASAAIVKITAKYKGTAVQFQLEMYGWSDFRAQAASPIYTSTREAYLTGEKQLTHSCAIYPRFDVPLSEYVISDFFFFNSKMYEKKNEQNGS